MVHENNNPTVINLTNLSGQIAALDGGLKLDKKELDLIQLKINWHIAVDLERIAEFLNVDNADMLPMFVNRCLCGVMPGTNQRNKIEPEEECFTGTYTDKELIAELRDRGW